MRKMWLVLGMWIVALGAYAQAALIQQQVNAQLPTNHAHAITAVDLQTAFGYVINGVSQPSFTLNNAILTSRTIVVSNANIVVSGTVSATRFVGDGSNLTGISATASSLPWGSITGIPAGIANISNSSGSVTATSFSGNISGTNGYFGSVSGSIGTFGSIGTGALAMTGSLTGSPLISTSSNGVVSATYGYFKYISATNGGGSSDWYALTNIPTVIQNISNSTGSVTVTSVAATNVAGTLTTAAQPNITSVGTLTGLTVNGQITGTAVGATLISATAATGTVTATNVYARNVSASFLVGDGSGITNLPAGGTPAAIVSGTTRVDARSDGSVSFTTGGIVTGYMDTSGRFVLPGISITTNQASFTTINANGKTTLVNVSATGNVQAVNFIGNGSQLTGINGMTISATQNHASTSIYVGFNSGGAITSGIRNATLGDGALASGTTSNQNVAVGAMAMASNTTGASNVAVGYGALQTGTTGGANVAIGAQALQNVSSTSNMVAIGTQAGQGNSNSPIITANNSTLVGAGSGGNISGTTANNTMLGYRSGVRVTTGSSNTLIGTSAGVDEIGAHGLTTGNNNIAIGAISVLASDTASNQMSIGNAIYGLNMVSGSTPLIGINTQTPTTPLTVIGTVSATAFVGDGSALTNLPTGGTPASLVSGTTRVDARNDNTISFTTGGVIAGYIDSNHKLLMTTVSATNVSLTNVQLMSSTLLGGQSLFARQNGSALILDGSAGQQYDFNTNRTIFGENDLTANVTPSATVHVSGTMIVTSLSTLTNTNMSGTLIAQNVTVLGTCTNCGGGGGGGTSISTTTFTAASNISNSTAIGFNAGVGTGISNTSYGASAGQAITTGTFNTFIGAAAGVRVTTASSNTLIGAFTGATFTNQMRNTIVGNSAGANNSNGFNDSVYMGYAASQFATGDNSVILGSRARSNQVGGSNSTTHSGDVVIGYSAYNGALTNNHVNNTIIGQLAALVGTTLDSNTIIGSYAGSSLTTGTNNLLIGAAADAPAATVDNALNIGNAIYGNISSGTLKRNLIGINVTSPTAAFEVSGTVKLDNIAAAAGLDYLCYDSTTGLVTYSATTCTVSDRKFKKNIESYNGSLEKVLSLQVRQFDFKQAKYGAGKQVGLIAQETEDVLPQLVSKGTDGSLSVDYAKLSVYAIGAIQEQQREIDALRAQLHGMPGKTTFMDRLKWLAWGE